MKTLSSRRFLLLLGFLCVIFLVLKIIHFHREAIIPLMALPEVKSVVNGNTAFALDLYQKLKAGRAIYFSRLTASPLRSQ